MNCVYYDVCNMWITKVKGTPIPCKCPIGKCEMHTTMQQFAKDNDLFTADDVEYATEHAYEAGVNADGYGGMWSYVR